jgi:hypothetical protein
MKLKSIALLTFAAFAFFLSASSAKSGPGHSHAKKEAGPNGGRLLTKIDPHAEFLVTADRKVRITFLDAKDKPTALGLQTVTMTAGYRAAPTRMTFTREGEALVSETALPEGNNFPAVVQIKLTPDARTIYERFTLNLAICGGCKLAEYACICGH